MLAVKNVYKSFGGIKALNGVSLKVETGSIVGLIGPNGSGKTTLFNVISGFYSRDSGEIYFKGERIDDFPPYEIAMRGLSRTFQISKAPRRMTVLENMFLAYKEQIGEGVLSALFRWGQISKQERVNLEKALTILELTGLKNSSNEYAGNLSGGQQKLLSLSRMMVADSDLILLDEPTAGINLTLVAELMKLIKHFQVKENKTFFIVEHNMRVISEICDMVYVLDSGKNIAKGEPEKIQKDEKVLKAYLGTVKEDSREKKAMLNETDGS